MSKNRFFALVGLVGFSEVALVIAGLLNPDWAVIGYFLNGLPLGLVWGLVVSYIGVLCGRFRTLSSLSGRSTLMIVEHSQALFL